MHVHQETPASYLSPIYNIKLQKLHYFKFRQHYVILNAVSDDEAAELEPLSEWLTTVQLMSCCTLSTLNNVDTKLIYFLKLPEITLFSLFSFTILQNGVRSTY